MRWYIKDSERKPDPEPVKTNPRLVFSVGIVLWALALVVTLFFYDSLVAAGRGWWSWTCVAGLGLGIVGLLKYGNRS